MGEWRRRHTVQHKDIQKVLEVHLNNYISTYLFIALSYYFWTT